MRCAGFPQKLKVSLLLSLTKVAPDLLRYSQWAGRQSREEWREKSVGKLKRMESNQINRLLLLTEEALCEFLTSFTDPLLVRSSAAREISAFWNMHDSEQEERTKVEEGVEAKKKEGNVAVRRKNRLPTWRWRTSYFTLADIWSAWHISSSPHRRVSDQGVLCLQN